MESKLTLKVSYRNEVRRLRDWPPQEASYESLRRCALSLFETADVGQSLHYVSGEGLCPLTAATFEDALRSASAGVLRVTLGADVATAPLLASGIGEETPAVVPEDAGVPNGAEGAVEGVQEAPSYQEGWANFKQQVVTDFQANYQDMKGAFGESEENRYRQVAGQVVGITAGVCATARLIPLHGTRLAARSIATAAKFPVEEGGPLSQEPAIVPEREVDLFKHQIFQDFEMGRREIQTAFGYFTGTNAQHQQTAQGAEGQEGQEGQDVQRPHLGREVVPAIASTLAGLGVATTLAPLRATRLLVASLAKRSPNPGTGAGPEDATS
ncbi:unnamed protein product [Effrenium voratum]|nr:unnamed protein product [Effrenium voratum]|mmetsp:Transcript_27155/g.64630  ORF Transcript_27155/g.64630 Transcript_27155/m.64630 type:complete len:326 (+) Transcript_27155:101-1078(+)|eukprot:CAMPEP_0181509524 /NCGR_PEP_ID=MMETSP1110-20121109/60387_1 /TAXON_ID=174948 /ORGANISM="Symbiodinium sp., Strain CCMP421" /LENGTH=325 /DNA_ID=CAMNT_0023639081 /DNA_START=88 /DNA_END=1065 /DNA_ORIENTATION=-